MRRVSIADLCKKLDGRTNVPFSSLVTITSIATDVEDVTPGSLFIPRKEQCTQASFDVAQENGAYAILISEKNSSIEHTIRCGIPLVFARHINDRLGEIASIMEGEPSRSLAIFVISGTHSDQKSYKLSRLLHLLGNPVALISHPLSQSLNRELYLKYPLTAVDIQEIEAQCLEEGASALIISANSETLVENSLVGTHIDISGYDNNHNNVDKYFGIKNETVDQRITPHSYLKDLKKLKNSNFLNDDDAAMAISMAMAAGITSQALLQAVEVGEEFSHAEQKNSQEFRRGDK